jgi:hypothetical protein
MRDRAVFRRPLHRERMDPLVTATRTRTNSATSTHVDAVTRDNARVVPWVWANN